MPNYEEVFGGRPITDLADDIRRRLRRVSSAQLDDIEDATSVGILAVLDYWVEKYANLADDEAGRRFNYASTFGTRRGREYLQALTERAKVEVHLDRGRSIRNGSWMEDENVREEEKIADPEPTAEERLTSDESAAVETFQSLSPVQRRRCVKALTGKGYCNRVAVHRDRKWAGSLLRSRACRFGLA